MLSGAAWRVGRQAFQDAFQRGVISFKDASDLAGSMGLGNPYESATNAFKAYYDIASNELPPTPLLGRFVGTANSVISAAAIRLDTFQSLINIVSSPVLTSAEFNSAKAAMSPLATVELPGTGRQLPSTMRTAFNAIGNWFNPAVRDQWLPLYKRMGIVR